MPHNLTQLSSALQPMQDQIATHPLIALLTTQSAIQIFMEHHVFAVWDFVCLVKALTPYFIKGDLGYLTATL